MINYKGYDIIFHEALEFDYCGSKVKNGGKMVYKTSCALGVCFARTPERVLEDTKRLIDTEISMGEKSENVQIQDLIMVGRV